MTRDSGGSLWGGKHTRLKARQYFGKTNTIFLPLISTTNSGLFSFFSLSLSFAETLKLVKEQQTRLVC